MTHLVSVEWLENNLEDPDLILLHVSLGHKAGEASDAAIETIPGALLFNLPDVFSDTKSELPGTMLSARKFQEEVRKLGISSSSKIVVFDDLGIYSSPRAWWIFKAMGHDNVFVLNGGLPKWKQASLSIASIFEESVADGTFVSDQKVSKFVASQEVLNAVTNRSPIIDVRSPDRFLGQVEESRPGLRKGHIPTAVNLPFAEFLSDGILKPVAEIEAVLALFKKSDNLIFSCGSGVTACIGALAATEAGYANVSVYDGSWSDWGRPSTGLPI